MAGLEARYEVKKINDPEGKHDECRYFVLDPQHDRVAERALSYYAAVADDDPELRELAEDIREWLHSIRVERRDA